VHGLLYGYLLHVSFRIGLAVLSSLIANSLYLHPSKVFLIPTLHTRTVVSFFCIHKQVELEDKITASRKVILVNQLISIFTSLLTLQFEAGLEAGINHFSTKFMLGFGLYILCSSLHSHRDYFTSLLWIGFAALSPNE